MKSLFSGKKYSYAKLAYLLTFLVIFFGFSSCKKEKSKPFAFQKVLVLGNSITVHPLYEAIGWYGNWGMAATKIENDYCHLLASKLNVQLKPVNISEWENTYSRYDLKKLDTYFAGQYDLIIIRLGENVNSILNLKEAFRNLIEHINAKNSDSKLVITGRFWTNEEIDDIFAEVAKEKGILFIKLSQLDVGANVSKLGATVYDETSKAYQITNQAVANHPNDTGMQKIAECIYDSLVAQFNLTK